MTWEEAIKSIERSANMGQVDYVRILEQVNRVILNAEIKQDLDYGRD